MKSLWFVIFVVASIPSWRISEAHADEPGKTRPPSADPMRGKAPGEVRDDNSLKMKLVWCPPGFVTMEYVEYVSELTAEKDDDPNEKDGDSKGNNPNANPNLGRTAKITPVKVLLTQGYWIGKYEVTQSEWK